MELVSLLLLEFLHLSLLLLASHDPPHGPSRFLGPLGRLNLELFLALLLGQFRLFLPLPVLQELLLLLGCLGLAMGLPCLFPGLGLPRPLPLLRLLASLLLRLSLVDVGGQVEDLALVLGLNHRLFGRLFHLLGGQCELFVEVLDQIAQFSALLLGSPL